MVSGLENNGDCKVNTSMCKLKESMTIILYQSNEAGICKLSVSVQSPEHANHFSIFSPFTVIHAP